MRNKLKAIRVEHGMTQVELAEKTGLSRATICKIENDENAIINTRTMAKICEVFGKSPGEIFLL